MSPVLSTLTMFESPSFGSLSERPRLKTLSPAVVKNNKGSDCSLPIVNLISPTILSFGTDVNELLNLLIGSLSSGSFPSEFTAIFAKERTEFVFPSKKFVPPANIVKFTLLPGPVIGSLKLLIRAKIPLSLLFI